MYGEEQVRQVTDFNENAAKIQRLNNIYLEVARNRENGNLIKAKWRLDTMEAELKCHAKRLDKEDQDIYLPELKRLNANIHSATSQGVLYYFLLKKEELLREIQQEIGMGTTYRDPGDDDMD